LKFFRYIFLGFFIPLVGQVFFSCDSDEVEDKVEIAFISHTRLNDNSGIIEKVSQSDLKKYDMLLLGGDMANLSSENDSILQKLETIFNLSNTNTLWALGNHDYTNPKLIEKYTKRPTYYSHYQNKTSFLVFDTQLDSSKIINQQLELFNQVVDTLKESKNLIILTHQLIWMRDHKELDEQINQISNGYKGDCNYCIQENNFYKDIYPKLVALKNKGINIYCLAGDIGFNTNKFEYITTEGIHFYATGMNFNQNENYFLKITQSLKNNDLKFEFISVDSL